MDVQCFSKKYQRDKLVRISGVSMRDIKLLLRPEVVADEKSYEDVTHPIWDVVSTIANFSGKKIFPGSSMPVSIPKVQKGPS